MSKPRVSKLKRIGPPQNGGWFYYSPDGHIVGPFDYEEQMEADITDNYKEVDYSADITELWKEMQEKGVTPVLIAEKFARVQPIPASAFEAAHALLNLKETE